MKGNREVILKKKPARRQLARAKRSIRSEGNVSLRFDMFHFALLICARSLSPSFTTLFCDSHKGGPASDLMRT